jgi:hypothetical protein
VSRVPLEFINCASWGAMNFLVVVQDLIVFPEESHFERVAQSSGRVFILRFRHDDRKLMFWMQVRPMF